MVRLIDLLLGKIPFNNWKTVIGAIALLLAQLNPTWEYWPLVKQILEALGITFGSVGVVHRAVKNLDGER